MYFCSGPPRTYAASAASGASQGAPDARIEDVALAFDPLRRVVARVSSSHVTLWSGSARARLFESQRLLVSVPRSGRFIAAVVESAASVPKIEGVADGGCADTRMLWTQWLSHDRLAVVERGSQFVELYAFEGLPSPGAGDTAKPAATSALASSSSSVAVQCRLLGEYPLNQGESQRDRDDVAWSMSGVCGGKYLFVGMESGLVCVVDVADAVKGSDMSATTLAKLWKIDVLAHLQPAPTSSDPTPTAVEPPSCYAITTATADPVNRIAALTLVACFEGGKCFIMKLSPVERCIDQLLSLVNTERNASSACYGRCTTLALDGTGSKLAIGWSDGGVSLFRLQTKRSVDASSTHHNAQQQQLHLEPLRELSMVAWGYTTADIGGVTAIAWTHDARALAVGYELRGFAVFSTDGCRLMSSLPQHNSDRPSQSSTTDELGIKEVCTHGTLRMAWSRESTSLLVIARGEGFEAVLPAVDALDTASDPRSQVNSNPPATSAPQISVEDLFHRVEVPLIKEEDGFCLSLSGAPGRCGAWVRSDNSFTSRKDGGIGPAEASEKIEGGDLLVAINDNDEVVNYPFEEIIQEIKSLPNDSRVVLIFLRLNWDRVYPLAVKALTSRQFLEEHNIRSLLDDEEEDLCIREYALRMQERFGDCDLEERPSMLEFEKRAKFEGWEAIQGTSKSVARHKYIKLLFAVFPVWNPHHILQALADFAKHEDGDKLREDEEMVQLAQLHRLHSSPRSRSNPSRSFYDGSTAEQTSGIHLSTTRRRRCNRLAFAEYDFARSVPLTNKNSKLVLLEDACIRKLSSPSLDDPCALMSAQSWSVPAEYDAKSCPLRLTAVSKSGRQIAVAGQRGFCLLNLNTGKWRMFGNVHEEQDIFVHALLWAHDDVILASFTRFREQHRTLHVVAFPRNHLDEESVLAKLEFPRETGGDIMQEDGVILAMETDEDDQNAFCLLKRELWCIGVKCTGGIGKQGGELQCLLSLKRQVKLTSSVLNATSTISPRGGGVLDFTIIPRVLHVQNQHSIPAARQDEDADTSSGWLSSIVTFFAGGEVPDQYKPEEVLPRFAFLTANGDVIIWDPENRSQRLLCSNVTTMARLFVTHEACESWPTPCRLMYGLYGADGMRLWLPLLDGVYLAHTKAFEDDQDRLETFLSCHDPLRAKTYEIEFGTAPATAELYEHVVKEYDIDLEAFVASTRQLDDGITNMRGCITTVDEPASSDLMLRFDSDVSLLGMQHVFGLLVGVSQDVYMPPSAHGLTMPCYDIFARVQPFFHSMLCLLVRNNQLAWARRILGALRQNHFALSSPTQELFLHAMLEACFSKDIPQAKFQQAIQLLQPRSETDDAQRGDMDEFCEIVAHVARKSEPSRLKVLFPAAGDPLELLAVCRQRGELRTAANFLLILEECSTSTEELPTNLAFRNACAAELVAQCIEQDELALAKHVVRVAREWVDSTSETCFIDEQLSKFAWQDLVSGRYERVVWCIEELQAELPQLRGIDMGIADPERDDIVQRLRESFVQSGRHREVGLLLDAVKRAKYEQLVQVLESVRAEMQQ